MKIIPFAKFVLAKGLKRLLNPSAIRDCKIDQTAKIGSTSELTNCSSHKKCGACEVWAGNPARMIKKRFSDKEIEIY